MNARPLQWIFRLVGVGLLVMALVVGGFGVWMHRRTSGFLDGAVPATGEVVELRESSGSEGGTTWSPVFTWTDDAGVERRSVAGFSSNPPSHEVGAPIDLLYDPGDPEDVRVDGFVSLWLVTTLLLGIAALQAFFAAVFGIGLPWAIGRLSTPAAPTPDA